MIKYTTALLAILAAPLYAASPAIEPALADPIRSERAILIPAAGSVQGGNGTHFRSDIQITNLRDDATQLVQLHWLPQGGADTPFVRVVQMPPLTSIASEDFVATVLQQTGLGAILIVGINAENEPDPLAELHAVSRIWTPSPGTGGTTSQSFSPVSLRATDERRLTVFGQRADFRYRTNVGIVNADPDSEHDFEIVVTGVTSAGAVFGPERRTLTLPAWSMQQVSLSGLPEMATLQIDAAPLLLESESPRPWIMYGSSVDNITGDAWSNVGFSTFKELEPNGN